MSDIKWIKLDVNIFDNRKIKMLEALPDGDAMVVIWFKLLCLAGQTNDGGVIYFTKEIPYTEDMLATVIGKPVTLVRAALDYFEQFGMIERVNDFLLLSSWEKYQNIEGMDKIREQTRERVAKHRAKQKLLECNVTGNVTVTDGNATEEDIEEDIDIKEKEILKKKKFVRPTVEEVKAYCDEKGYSIDPEAFVAFYESKGWVVGKSPMKSWKAAVVTWVKKDMENKPKFFVPDPNKIY